MSRCREVSGVLFKRECREPAVAQCWRCQKPVCGTHSRRQGYGMACVSCLRSALQNPMERGNLAYLRDDPFFFWYFAGDQWLGDPYGADDFALFDTEQADFAQGQDPEWRGS